MSVHAASTNDQPNLSSEQPASYDTPFYSALVAAQFQARKEAQIMSSDDHPAMRGLAYRHYFEKALKDQANFLTTNCGPSQMDLIRYFPLLPTVFRF